jgi:hypothetical protein
VADPDDDVALQKLIELAASRLRDERSDVAHRLHTFTLKKLQTMGASAEAADVSEFSV